MTTPFLNAAQAIEDLKAAALWLNSHEWCQGTMFLYQGISPDTPASDTAKDNVIGACAYGAVAMVSGEYFALSNRSSNVGRAFYRVMGQDMTSYNDAEGRTRHQMIRALEHVASVLEEDPSRA